MPKIELEIPADIWDPLKKVIPENDIPKLAIAALQEWAKWLGGTSRPATIAELEIARIFDIYSDVLKDGSPSVDQLGKLFGMPMGRARYIIQSLEYRRRRFMQMRQFQAISRALEKGQWSEDKKRCIVIIDRGSQTLLETVISDLKTNKVIESVVKGEVTLEGMRYDLGDGHHKKLTAKFKELLKEFQA